MDRELAYPATSIAERKGLLKTVNETERLLVKSLKPNKPHCFLITKVLTSEVSPPAGRMSFRGTTLTNNAQLVLVPTASTDKWSDNVQTCQSMGLELMPFPTALRDTVVVGAPGKVSIDMKTHISSLAYFNNAGVALDTSLRRLANPTPSNKSIEHCFVSDHFVTFSIQCAKWQTKTVLTACMVPNT